MSKRKVVVFYSQAGKKEEIEIDNTITIWSQLAPKLSQGVSDKKVIIKETQVTLEADKAELPTTDFSLFVYQKRSKAGAVPVNPMKGWTITKIRTTPGNNLRRKIRRMVAKGHLPGFDTTAETDVQRKAFIEWFRDFKFDPSVDKEVKKAVKKVAKSTRGVTKKAAPKKKAPAKNVAKPKARPEKTKTASKTTETASSGTSATKVIDTLKEKSEVNVAADKRLQGIEDKLDTLLDTISALKEEIGSFSVSLIEPEKDDVDKLKEEADQIASQFGSQLKS